MNRLAFEREFLKLAGIAFACIWELMGNQIPGRKLYCIEGADPEVLRRNLEFSALGLVDHCQEMRLLCQETRKALDSPKRPSDTHMPFATAGIAIATQL